MVYPACRFAHAGYLLVIVAVVVGAFSLGYSVHDYPLQDTCCANDK